MGMNAINWMAKQKTGDDKSKSALFWLAFHMNDKTGECFPSISTLQAEMEVKSDNTVRSALRRLRDAGLISWERETRDGLTVKTKYRLHMHGSMTAGTSADKGTSTIAVPQPLKGGTSTVEGGTSTIAVGVPQPLRTNMEIEQGINREQNKEVLRAPAGAPQPPEMSDDEIADLLESVPQEKGERPPFEKGAHLSEKGDHPSPAPKRKRVSNVQKPESVSEQVWEDLENLFADAQIDVGSKPNDEPKEKPKRKRITVAKPEGVSEQVWTDFCALRNKRRAPITETALKGIQREADKAGITLEAALSTCCERGWQGFKASWYEKDKTEQNVAPRGAEIKCSGQYYGEPGQIGWG